MYNCVSQLVSASESMCMCLSLCHSTVPTPKVFYREAVL